MMAEAVAVVMMMIYSVHVQEVILVNWLFCT